MDATETARARIRVGTRAGQAIVAIMLIDEDGEPSGHLQVKLSVPELSDLLTNLGAIETELT